MVTKIFAKNQFPYLFAKISALHHAAVSIQKQYHSCLQHFGI